MIQHLTHEQIDKTKWDVCVQQCTNTLPYAFSWYLDMVSPGWEALVSGDYESVMPLTWKKKWGVKYLYQPFFTQQLGVFYKGKTAVPDAVSFAKAIPGCFRFIDICLNSFSGFEHTDIKLKRKKNYVLNLNKPYEKLTKGYDKHCMRNVKKAYKFKPVIKPAEPGEIIRFYEKHKSAETKNVGKADYEMLSLLSNKAATQQMMMAYGVYNDNEELLAGGLFLITGKRIIYLLGTASGKGKESRAMYALIDYMLMQRSGFAATFDFEGSEIPGIARFFKGFGAEKETYYKLKINRLPWIIRWLK